MFELYQHLPYYPRLFRSQQIFECLEIKRSDDLFSGVDRDGQPVIFNGDEVVSMNFWGFKPYIFKHLQVRFEDFLKKYLLLTEDLERMAKSIDDLTEE